MFNTVQEACDYAVLKIVEQGGRCLDEKGRCVYGKDGRHCPIGWLLDPDNKELMDYKGVVGELILSGLPIPSFIKDNENAFCGLQMFHDAMTTSARRIYLETLSRYIDTSAPQYKQWVKLV